MEEIITTLYPNGKRQGTSLRCGDIDGKPGTSFAISLKGAKAGFYLDHSDHSVRGNIFSLLCHKKNWSYRQAIEDVARLAGIAPEEEFDDRPKFTVNPALASRIKTLTDPVIQYAASRGISPETLMRYGVGSDQDGTHVIFPHYEDNGGLVLLKHWPVNGSKKMYTNSSPGHVLFGKSVVAPEKSGGTIIICEGQWDALAWAEAGFYAVSIPSGVSNEQWIRNDWSYLRQFTEVFLSFDEDQPGIEACKSAQGRLGVERCKVIRLPHKDANDVLLAEGPEALRKAFAEALERPVESLIDRDVLKKTTKSFLSDPPDMKGIPFFLSGMKRIRFRKHEWTLWYGMASHGKSSAIQNQILYQASIGVMNFIASFEQPGATTMGRMLKGYTCVPDIAHDEVLYDMAFEELSDRVRMFDSMRKANPERLIQVMRKAHQQLGVESFVIDNVMTLDIDRGDNTAQSNAADMIREFVASEPVHVHVVAHPRKPDAHAKGPPTIHDIRGASEWGDMPDNVVCVYRDVQKHEKIEAMLASQCSPAEIMQIDQSMSDGQIVVRKQRATGNLPVIQTWYDKKNDRFVESAVMAEPLWTPG